MTEKMREKIREEFFTLLEDVEEELEGWGRERPILRLPTEGELEAIKATLGYYQGVDKQLPLTKWEFDFYIAGLFRGLGTYPTPDDFREAGISPLLAFLRMALRYPQSLKWDIDYVQYPDIGCEDTRDSRLVLRFEKEKVEIRLYLETLKIEIWEWQYKPFAFKRCEI